MFKQRPWIWVIIAHLALIAVLSTVVVIARRHGPKEVPITGLNHGH